MTEKSRPLVPSNVHTHTVYCDGANTPEEMVQGAIQQGLRSLGFSGHSYLPFGKSWTMSENGTLSYQKEIRSLQEKYKGQIEIALGIEWDLYSEINRSDYDYTIGSVHYIKDERAGKYRPIDEGTESFDHTIRHGFEGDALAMVRSYYDRTVEVASRLRPDILGHFDAIIKLNEKNRFFDEQSKAYQTAALEAADRIADCNPELMIEVNTGGIFRGYTSEPYPAPFLLRHFCERKMPIILTSDAHCPEALMYRFSETLDLAEQCGYQEIRMFQNGKFVPLEIARLRKYAAE